MTRHGRCICGAVTVTLEGEPVRVGLCHCTTCRRETGSPFGAFAIWPAAAVTIAGATGPLPEAGDHRRFCLACGSPVVDVFDADEVEVRIGVLDVPTGLVPTYESWTIRREPWLAPLPGARQYERNRDD